MKNYGEMKQGLPVWYKRLFFEGSFLQKEALLQNLKNECKENLQKTNVIASLPNLMKLEIMSTQILPIFRKKDIFKIYTKN